MPGAILFVTRVTDMCLSLHICRSAIDCTSMVHVLLKWCMVCKLCHITRDYALPPSSGSRREDRRYDDRDWNTDKWSAAGGRDRSRDFPMPPPPPPMPPSPPHVARYDAYIVYSVASTILPPIFPVHMPTFLGFLS